MPSSAAPAGRLIWADRQLERDADLGTLLDPLDVRADTLVAFHVTALAAAG